MSATVSIIEMGKNSVVLSPSGSATVQAIGGRQISLNIFQGGARGAKGIDGTVAGGGVGVSAGVASQNSGIITFQNSHNVSFGLNGGVMTASFAGSDAGGVYSFANSNGVTFGDNGSTITASVAPAIPQTEQTQNRFNLSLAGITAGVMALVSSGVMTLAATNNITLSQAGNAVTISGPATHAQQTGISGLSAGAGSISAGTVVFSNSNGVSFGQLVVVAMWHPAET